MMKLVFLRLLENILIEKKKRIVESTITDFKRHCLMEKGFRGLRRLWHRQSKMRLLNMVAKEFY